jgi:pimeloyl-ACP methyl ester carboxylesterase
MVSQTQEITFVVPGQALPPGQVSAEAIGTTKAAVRVGARRGGGETVRLAARPNDDIVLLHIANGPTLYLHPEDARDLMRAQTGGASATESRGAEKLPVEGDVTVLPQLSWRGVGASTSTRSGLGDWLGEVWINTVEIVTNLIQDKAAKILTAAATKKLDGRVDPGVYALSPDELPHLKGSGKKIDILPPSPDGSPILVFIHGTFLDTASSFGKLWSLHPARVRQVFQHYGGRVYALDHPTVGQSPFANALTLVRALRKGARLHMVTHSRGGIVAELLARICGGQGLRPEDFALFKGEEYRQHLAELHELAALTEQISVERVVRVACPARGTLLASRRLDAYISILKWSMELAGIPVMPELVQFLSEVARRRTDPADLPGLEAMMPDRPVAKWLNAPAEPVPGDLRVVAGDIQGDSIVSWVKTLLSDAFFWTDNDLMVQTRSMYGGTPRSDGAARFLLDRGAKVAHMNYFANERTAGAITNALLQEQPAEFRPIGPLSWAGKDASGTRAALAIARSRGGNASERPAVFVLPGILGSHLKVDGERVWLSWRFINNLDALKWDPPLVDHVGPDGPIGMYYDDFIEYLAVTHEVIPFSFDWRRPMEDEARRLADAVDAALTARNATQQPVRMVAHSMGGMVARTMRLERPETWKRMMARQGARVLMLGTPNGGSWAPMQVLSGDDTFGNLVAMAGCLFEEHKARQMVAGMPGLMQLQAALLDPSLALAKTAGWQQLADEDLKRVLKRRAEKAWWHNDELQMEPYKWGVPPQTVLDQAVALRRRLDAQKEDLVADASKILLVVGKARSTPAAIRITDDGVEYLDLREGGDGRVTNESACLPGVRTWEVDVAHSNLADAEKAFEGYLELLMHGETTKLDPLKQARSGVRAPGDTRVAPEELVPSRPSRALRASEPPAVEREVFETGDIHAAPSARPAGPRLRVSVMNGNLKFVRPALMLGHYQSLRVTGSEEVMDRLLDGAMSKSLRAGLYPSAVGSHQVFLNTRHNPDNPFLLPRPAAVIVAGLGEEGALRTTQLSETVRQAALAYGQRIGEGRAGGPIGFELAATVIGSGGSGMSVGAAAQAIAIGIRQANERLASVNWPIITHLQLIELFFDRATEAQHALHSLAESYPEAFDLEPHIVPGQGELRRPPESGYRGAGYDFITVQRRGSDDNATIEFTLDTRRARSEVRGQATQSKLVDELVRAAADDRNRDEQIGRSLFQLLVPIELEPFLSGSVDLLLQLDPHSAAYPWELLDTQRYGPGPPNDSRPWAVRTRLLRKLRTTEFRDQPVGARSEKSALVIGEPLCDSSKYPSLPQATKEAQVVAAALGTDAKLKKNALAIVNALLERPYRIIHIAGHGDFLNDCTGGVVLSNGAVLGPREFKAMRIVPELVFINCCHLGRLFGSTSTLGKFAANVAEQLIQNGVRCVVAAGWAVNDVPAMDFAKRFYQELMRGQRFVEAIGHAREATWKNHPGSNTWAAYQCYGDPDWRYLTEGDDAARRMPDSTHIISPRALEIELETLAVQSKFKEIEQDRIKARLEQLEAKYGSRWGKIGYVAEAFGALHAEVNHMDDAIRWYEHAVSADDGSASLHASEQLGNLRARRGEKMKDTAEGRSEIEAAIEILQGVVATHGRTIERESLLGSAFKRLSMLEKKSRRRAAARVAIEMMATHYRNAENLARKNGNDSLHYPAMNRMSAELILNGANKNWPGFDSADLAAVRQSLQKKVMQDPDFWAVVGLTELRIYEALAQRRLSKALNGILAELTDLKNRVSSKQMWDSVHAQARFTLQPYMETSKTPEERKSARELLLKFEEFTKA